MGEGEKEEGERRKGGRGQSEGKQEKGRRERSFLIDHTQPVLTMVERGEAKKQIVKKLQMTPR